MRHFRKFQRSVALLCTLAMFATMPAAQQAPAPAKRPLTHQDYDSWRSISAQQISRDGKFVAYAYVPQDGDGEIVVRNIATGVDWRAPRGYRPPVPPPDDSGTNVAEFQAEQARLLRPVFTADSRFIVFGTEPTKAEVNKAKKEKKKPEEMPKNGLGIMDLSNGTVTRVERVKTFRRKTARLLCLLDGSQTERETEWITKTESSPSGEATAPAATPSPSATASQRASSARGKKKEYGTELVLRNTATTNERKFSDVLDFTISRDAKTLVFTTSSHKEEANGVYTVATENDGEPVALLSGKGKYQRLTWDEENTQLAFTSDKEDADANSWGGYQIAYMVTQTNRFRAAAPGALVANMTSAYSGIRWGTGLPRQFQYERSQSRIGGSLWEYPLRFLDNSPIFRADRVETPLLMIHNDEDDAVPWYQGIEYFLALRRLGKEAYMFSYNGEKHGLRKRINQKDYTRRLQEFFDHFLKGAPAPDWMEKGIPYLQREKEKEKYRTSEDKQ